ncbi:MAG: AAA-like domain-containing protein, partial [Cyanobacteria bacterium P01_F01_bin.3]
MVKRSIYTSGGTVQAGKGVYLPRAADAELLQLCREGQFAYVLTSRQMGKSSLMIQTARALSDEGIVPIVIDLTDIGVQGIAAEDWYLGFLLELEDKLEQSGEFLEPDVYEWWQAHEHLTLTQRFNRFFRAVLLAEVAAPIVVFVDEIDTSLSLDFTDDFFIGIRSFYTARAQESVFQRLSFVLIGVATPSDLILDARRTPFNIGDRVELTDFTAEESRPLSAGLGLPEVAAQEVMAWVLDWTGGHPYLTQRLCIELTRRGQESWTESGVARVVEETFFGETGKQDDHLKFVRDMLTERAPTPLAVLQTYRDVYHPQRVVPDDEQSIVKSHLKLSGVVKRERDALEVRNPIYGNVFDQQWIRQVWPEGWWDRIKPAMPLIAGLGLVAAALSGLSWYAIDRAAFAEEQQKKTAIALAGEAEQREVAEAQRRIAEAQRDAAIASEKAAEAARQDADKKRAEAEAAEKTAEAAKQAEAEQRQAAEQQTLIAQQERSRAEQQTLVAQQQQKKAEDATSQAKYQETVARLQAQAATVLNWIPTPIRATKGLVTSIATLEQSEKEAPQVMDTARASLLNAVQIAREKNRLEGHTGQVYSVAVSRDGNTIVSSSSDNTVRLWDRQGNPIGEPFEGHTDYVSSVAMSPDGNTIVSGSGDNTVRLWDR